MKIFTLAFLLLCLYGHTSWCQDDRAARESYQKAEAAYLTGKWMESLGHVQETENLLGRKSPKVQLLKVLVYEKLSLLDITHLDAALATARAYLQMQDQLPPLHEKYIAQVRDIERALPAQATASHDARVRQQELEAKQAWKAQANKTRLGFGAAPPNANWTGTELGIVIGKRSRFWVIGTSTVMGQDLTVDDDFNLKMAEKLNNKPDGYIHRTTILHAGYFQGIRVLPRERDFIKPFIGGRAIYHGEYSRKYSAKNSQETDPDQEVLDNIREYGLDPADFYSVKTSFQSGFSFDIVIGAMLHLGGTTLYTGMDIMNSKRLQFGVAFKL